jgi:uncharacterized protein YcbX
MITVKAIHIAPVKSLGLQHPAKVHVGPRGIVEDRRFYLVNQQGQLLTQRQMGQLVQVNAEYMVEPEWLRLSFPNGAIIEGPVEPGRAIGTRIWDRRVRGHVLEGDWNAALSDFCGEPVFLVASDEPGQCYDEFPISILSQASLQELNHRSDGAATFDSRRFRPNFLLEGCQPHQEDTWLSRSIQIGKELRVLLLAPDPRCAITTHDPATGDRDADTLRLILSYRPSPRTAYFGVYGIVERPGTVLVGDLVTTSAEMTPKQ